MPRTRRSKIALLALIGIAAALTLHYSPTKPALPVALANPTVQPPLRPDKQPDTPCPDWGRKGGRRSPAKIVEAGNVGPDGRRVMIDFLPEFWKANIASRGQGCCVQRSVDFAAHWQNVPALWDFPEWIKKTGRPGGCYAELLSQRITSICKDRNLPEPDYVNVESKDYSLLKLVIGTGRLPCVDYSGNDGVHYPGSIAHCVCLSYVDDECVAVLDNNFPPDKLLWMPAAEFQKRWGGWIIALCAPRPPAAPKN